MMQWDLKTDANNMAVEDEFKIKVADDSLLHAVSIKSLTDIVLASIGEFIGISDKSAVRSQRVYNKCNIWMKNIEKNLQIILTRLQIQFGSYKISQNMCSTVINTVYYAL